MNEKIRDVNSVLSAKQGGLVHDLEGAFTGCYFIDNRDMPSHSRMMGTLGSSQFPIVRSGNDQWLLADRVYDHVAVVVTRKALVSDHIVRSISYPGSPIWVYELAGGDK